MMPFLRLVVATLVLLGLCGCIGNNSGKIPNDPDSRAAWSNTTPPGTRPIDGPTQNDATH